MQTLPTGLFPRISEWIVEEPFTSDDVSTMPFSLRCHIGGFVGVLDAIPSLSSAYKFYTEFNKMHANKIINKSKSWAKFTKGIKI